MTTRTDVAQWMIDTINQQQELSQEDAVWEIERKFGADWIYENENGNPAIDRKVLIEFGRLKGDRIEWDGGGKFWCLA